MGRQGLKDVGDETTALCNLQYTINLAVNLFCSAFACSPDLVRPRSFLSRNHLIYAVLGPQNTDEVKGYAGLDEEDEAICPFGRFRPKAAAWVV